METHQFIALVEEQMLNSDAVESVRHDWAGSGSTTVFLKNGFSFRLQAVYCDGPEDEA